MDVLFLCRRHYMGFNATTRPFYPRERNPVLIVGWPPGMVWTGAENLAPTGIRFPDRPTRGGSLYRLSCPGPQIIPNVYCSVHSNHIDTSTHFVI